MAEHWTQALPRVRGERVEIRPGRHISLAQSKGHRYPQTVVFFAHGGGGNKDQWREQWRELEAEGYSLVAWDLLGHGASDKPRRATDYAWDELVADQVAVLRRHAGERNILAAHSFGTGLSVSSLLALQAQGQGALIDSALLLGTQLSRPLGSGGLLSLPAWLLEWFRPVLSKGFRERAWHAGADPELVDYEERLTRHNRLDVFKALVSQASWLPEAELDRLLLPVRIVSGDSDGLTPAERAQALHQRLPNSQFEVLENCGHQLMLEKPQIVTRHLRELLAIT
ncbi:alpha/beta hydrolase [Pseudomonas nicosulfuronedens]|uniref:Alpha/beta hydrolase n=1 Tax=Pseudomonas nicosulfuronedens TaxID=2571105 RepID=A0A5R9RA08_9PSED|nr:alpha/beta hydrolase [Pseudomonas nicosulfuronedens]MDH1011133.1 alpha/beta hydrolase [Pseudomonas nicosulfuronedens]MDH1981148.1 alpha/beta hydrolase [Pseudomonas nicosulfuronedens]MDH2026903.1 alpha/beta hydrolase [Pseudomonas nicosulfuronedens]TLX79596.1 alpha/beta hydrolase [Pseudomonas nicosulfuronedens]